MCSDYLLNIDDQRAICCPSDPGDQDLDKISSSPHQSRMVPFVPGMCQGVVVGFSVF